MTHLVAGSLLLIVAVALRHWLIQPFAMLQNIGQRIRFRSTRFRFEYAAVGGQVNLLRLPLKQSLQALTTYLKNQRMKAGGDPGIWWLLLMVALPGALGLSLHL